MTDRPKNLSFLTPTSVINSMESTRYLAHILTLNVGQVGNLRPIVNRPACGCQQPSYRFRAPPSVCIVRVRETQMPTHHLTRRKLFQTSTAIASTALLRGAPASSGSPNLYESIGVTPLVNCRGTFTIITGSRTLPEVKKAMDEDSRHYVHMDELMNAVGQRLAELTKAEWGIVTAGCAAALTHATLACIAGTNPERMQRIPKLAGMKNEVVIPKHSRNVYDHAVRMTGVDIIEVNSPEELESSINPRTALIMIMASPRADSGPLSTVNVD